MQVGDLHLLGIPRSSAKITMHYPRQGRSEYHSEKMSQTFRPVITAVPPIVARVQPRTSRGITDLFLLILVRFQQKSQKKCNPPTVSLIGWMACKKLNLQRLADMSFARLPELTRGITPPTANGHAPPPI